MPLTRIRLELARSAGQPAGNPEIGYEFVAPLDTEGHLDLDAWHHQRARCTVRRFRPNADEEHGRLVHRGGRWAFHYDGTDQEDDEPIFRFQAHALKPGEYVTITEDDGVAQTFRIEQAVPLAV